MTSQANSQAIISEDEVKSFEQALIALELSLATVQKVIERHADMAPLVDSTNGVHLALYVMHTKAVLMLCRQLLALNQGETS